MDAIDRRLIDLLRDNARTPFAELARKVGLSAPAVHDRVNKLESAGIIRGYRAEIAPEAIGLTVTAVIGLERLIVELNRTTGVARTRTAIALSTKWEERPQTCS